MTATPRGAEPETDDSQNPTSASPVSPQPETTRPVHEPERDTASRGRRGGVQLGGAEVFGQVQDVVADLSRQARPLVRQATPILRELAAKAAELAAVVAENAGPAARRAAELTQDLGTRVAARSREVASDLRRSEERELDAGDETSPNNSGIAASDADRAGTSASSRSREGTQRPPATPGL